MSSGRLRTLRSFIYAIGIHIAAAVLVAMSLDFDPYRIPKPQESKKIVQAVAVDQRAVKRELSRLRAAEQRKQTEEAQARNRLEGELEKARRKREAEEQRLAQLEQERLALAEQRKEEARRLEEVEAKRKQEEQRRAEEKRKAEEEKKRLAEQEKEKRQREAEKKALAEQKKREEEARRRQALLDEMAAEEQAGVIDQYIAAISDTLARHFNKAGFTDQLTCTLHVRMVPGGEVVEVKVVKSSGNAIFDRQAEIAVQKASPLPVPDDAKLFESTFRDVNLRFNPWG